MRDKLSNEHTLTNTAYSFIMKQKTISLDIPYNTLISSVRDIKLSLEIIFPSYLKKVA